MTRQINYLEQLDAWDPERAQLLAVEHNMSLSAAQIDILLVARDFYNQYGFSPSMRPLCKSVAAALGIEMGRSIYLNQQFPGSPAKLVAQLGGLPKPKNCL
jgi:tRNA 2-thiouridine synthesizing protein E